MSPVFYRSMDVLNSCKTALELRRYNTRHDAVLRKTFEVVKETIPTTTKMSVDLDGEYLFPNHITSTDLRPDIVWWDDSTKLVTILELTIPYDTLVEEAAMRKIIKYGDLLNELSNKNYTAKLLTVEMGSRDL